jgi:hypothetical protein
LIQAKPVGQHPYRCRYLLANRKKADYGFISHLEKLSKPEEKASDVASLFQLGINKIAQK